MNGQWLCIKLNMKNWAYRSAKLFLYSRDFFYNCTIINKKLTNVLEWIFHVWLYEWIEKKSLSYEMNGSMLLYVKEISLAVQKGLTMLLLHFIIPHDTYFLEKIFMWFNPTFCMTLYGVIQWIIEDNYDGRAREEWNKLLIYWSSNEFARFSNCHEKFKFN